MRLNRLHLTRYGKFTDTTVDFGAAPAAGQPDLHVVFGANEAGKSTALSAWLDLLFQIPTRSAMGYLHPYPSMQIGAELELAGRTHDLIRVKKRAQSLLDGHGAPVGEALLHNGLRGLDRDSYAAMFSLNRQTLDDGGESILASQGDLGELLFQASAGLTDLTAQLSEVRGETDAVLSPSGRKGRLRDLCADHDALERQIAELDTAAPEFARLTAARDAAQADWAQARDDAMTAQSRLTQLERLQSGFPLADRLARLETQIAGFGELPEPPAGWLDELPELDRAETQIATRRDSARRSVETLEAECAALPKDDPCLRAEDGFVAAERLKSAHDTALTDLPRRISDREAERSAVRDGLARLGQPQADPGALLLPAAVAGRLRDLIERHSGLETAQRAAVTELRRARDEAERAEARLSDAGGAQADLGGLRHLVERLRRDDLLGAQDRAAETLDDASARLAEALAGLSPWRGSAEALADLTPPDRESLARLETALAETGRSQARESETLTRLRDETAQAAARLEGLRATGSVTPADAAAARAEREAAWRAHRAALDADSADRFEAAMRFDDQIAASLSEHRAQAAKIADATQLLLEKRQQSDAAEARHTALTTRHDQLTEEIAAMIAAVCDQLPADMRIAAFIAWLDRREAVVLTHAAVQQAARELDRARDRITTACADLRLALRHSGQEIAPEATLVVVLETAQALLDRAAEIAALRDKLTASRDALEQRGRDADTAQSQIERWRQDWRETCRDTWLRDVPVDAAAMRAILDELDRLRGHVERLADLDRRIGAMEANRDAFDQAVRQLAAALGADTDVPVAELWRALEDRRRQARDTQTRRRDLMQRLQRAQDEAGEVDRAAQLHASRTGEFARFFATASWEATRAALHRAGERAELVRTRHTLTEDLCALMRSAAVAQALAALDETDPGRTEAEIVTLKADLETLNARREEAHSSLREAERAVQAIGGDGAVARLQERRQTLLLEIEEEARRLVRMRLGIVAVDQALRRYRDTHRSGMMERASDAFRKMTDGRYAGLAAQPDGQREVLVAMAADGGSKEAAQLSEGTRAQLYLALRIAGYHEFVDSNGQVPFVADDVMESFDDTRSARTLDLLSDMSRRGQVIYLTHHEHLCEIARAACPQVHIHELT